MDKGRREKMIEFKRSQNSLDKMEGEKRNAEEYLKKERDLMLLKNMDY